MDNKFVDDNTSSRKKHLVINAENAVVFILFFFCLIAAYRLLYATVALLSSFMLVFPLCTWFTRAIIAFPTLVDLFFFLRLYENYCQTNLYSPSELIVGES